VNKHQKRYAMARAKYQLAKDEASAYEQAFIIRENVRNKDGSVPSALWAMDEESEEYYDELCKRLDSEEEYRALCDAESDAHRALVAAEESLIDYGLSIPMPESVRKTLSEHRQDWKVRERLIDLTFRLNTKTVRKGWGI